MRYTSIQISLIVAFMFVVGGAGCALEYEYEGGVAIGSGEQFVTSDNGLPNNGLPNNGLPNNGLPNNGLPNNGLPNNGLPNNGLVSSAIDAQWDLWLNDPTRGALNATLMSYIVRCALPSDASASYTDALNNTWEWDGEIGLVPGWETGSITAAEQRWISSCVLSLVNGTGATVTISQRGPSGSGYQVTEAEVSEWDLKEGAFYGDMFGSNPVYYACHSSNSASDVTGRVCTQGGSQCAPIEVVGQCKDYCTKTTRTVGGTNYEVWTDCEDDAANTFAEVTTAALES